MPPYPSLKDAIDQLLASISKDNTRNNYGYALGVFLEFCQEVMGANPHTGQLGENTMVDYWRWLVDRGYQLTTVTTYMAAARRLFSRLFVEDQLATNYVKAKEKLKDHMRNVEHPDVTAGIKDKRIPQILAFYDEIPLPDDDLSRLRVLRVRAVVHTIYSTAGRVSEVASLTRADVQDGGVREVMITGKGEQKRIIFLTDEAADRIAAYCKARGEDGHPALFISHGRNYGSALSRQWIWKMIKDAVRALGLHQSVSPHDFRHYRATRLLNDGARLEEVQAILGHADISTTRAVYAKTETANLRRVFDTYTR